MNALKAGLAILLLYCVAGSIFYTRERDALDAEQSAYLDQRMVNPDVVPTPVHHNPRRARTLLISGGLWFSGIYLAGVLLLSLRRSR